MVSGLVVDVEVVSQGTDNGLLGPCVERIAERYGVSPDAMLADAGFQSVEDIEQLASERHTRTYMPVKNAKKHQDQGKNPFEPKKGDSVAVGQWRQGMGEPESQEIYKSRASSAEWVHAGYVKQTEQVYAEQTRQKLEKQFHRRAKELGYEVKKVEPATPTLVT